jgi:hypothetical protein
MIVWITHAKVGHRQTPYKQQSPPREGFVVCTLSELLANTAHKLPQTSMEASVIMDFGNSFLYHVKSTSLKPDGMFEHQKLMRNAGTGRLTVMPACIRMVQVRKSKYRF